MFCKECGKSISDDSKFCSYCGSRVEAPSKLEAIEKLDDDVHGFEELERREISRTTSQVAENGAKPINLKRTANFNWDLDGFPSDDQRKEKKVSINWQDVLMSGDRNEHSTKIKRDVEGRKTDSFFFNPNIDDVDKSVQNNDDADLQSFLFEDKSNSNEVIDKTDADHAGTGDSFAVNKFYTFNKKNEEFQRLLDKEYEKLKNDVGFQEIEDSDKEFCTSDESISDAQKGGQESESDSPIFQEPKSNGDTSRADEDSDMGILEDSDQPKESGNEEQTPDGSSQSEGDIEVKDDGEGDDSIKSEIGGVESEGESPNTQSEQSKDELNAKRKRRGRADNRSKTKFDFHAIFDDEDVVDSDNNVKQKKTHKKVDEASKDIKTLEAKVEEQSASDDEGIRPKSKGMKVLSIIFYIILILVILILGIKLVAPDSSLAVNIDRTYETIVDKITGKTPQGAEVEENKTIEDWISDASSANQNISKIESDLEIKVDIANKDFKGVDASKPFSDSIWYTTDDGQDVYYGGDIVKAVVAYYSDLNTSSGGINDTKVDHLKIGEIRTGEFGFFVATSFGDDKDKKNIYNLYIEPEGTVMKVKDSIEIKKVEEAEE
ncbi:MAG: zinc-ribbon domain-containing protein [Clostridiales bacterium]|nr:zinc-ribbon domain-containing protein [Clostridiales bacterium]MDY6117478.1 zinc-ribbon domain-containing protein [Anaerovoracaceae bacterium]